MESEKLIDQYAKNTVTFILSDDLQFSCKADNLQENSWSLYIEQELVDLLRSSSYTTVAFVEKNLLHTGESQIVRMDESNLRIVISRPEQTTTRPIRKAVRIRTQLPTAIIIMSNADKAEEFIPRVDNYVIDLSLSGAKLVCKSLLDDTNPEIMLLTCLDKEDTTIKEKQIYLHATKVRETGNSPLTGYPYSYGIEFNLVFPQYKKILAEFVVSL